MIERYNPSARYKNRAQKQLTGLLFFAILLILAFGAGLWMGRQGSAARLASQEEQTKRLQEETSTLQQHLTEAKTRAKTANARYEQLQLNMEELVPEQGPLRELLDQIKSRLAEGTSAERLSFLIRSARPPRNCSDPKTRRFIASTPTYKGPDSYISIDNGMILIKGSGKSATNEQGQPEAWYDPGKSVSISFEKFGGEIETKSGTLPLNISMVVKGREYRFTLSSGARSFIKATFDSCDYP